MTGLLPSMPRPHGKEVYGKSYLEMYLLLPQLITLTCYRAILQCFVVISNEAIMVPPYSLFNQAALYHLQLLPKNILFAMYIVLTQQQVHMCRPVQSVMQMHWLHLHVNCKYNHMERQHPLNQCVIKEVIVTHLHQDCHTLNLSL